MEYNLMDSLPSVRIALDTSTDDLDMELYQPCLSWANRFDRGVGYFTTGWIEKNVAGLSNFASRGGVMRLITSPILSENDRIAIEKAEEDNLNCAAIFQDAILKSVDQLAKEMKKDVFNAFAWMVHDGIIVLKFALPVEKLADGIFHAKFGIFEDDNGNALSFSGSINDSKQGFNNYEEIKVFATWKGTGEYVDSDKRKFERLWNENDRNVRIFNTTQAIKEKIFVLKTSERPYKKRIIDNNKWIHQDRAVDVFLQKKNGILAMATGTGKTNTAKRIIKKLFDLQEIKRVVISMQGTDLLDQWADQIRDEFPDKACYLHYEKNKEMSLFTTHPDNAILLVSSDSNNLLKLLNMFEKLPGDFTSDTLFVFDEVHGMGSATRVENLRGKFANYKYRLGLSATPEREYDEEGNDFIENEIGPVIFEFSLKDAIEKGILCPFNYIPLEYELTQEEKEKKRDIIARFEQRRKSGELVSDSEMYTALSLVNKTASEKINVFKDYLLKDEEILKKCIIFVQTMEYGELVQEVIIKHENNYHTYYSGDEKNNLESFANGTLECLLTCKKLSEGIDIKTVENIVLFSSDRSKLVTTQRIGRALRTNPYNDSKIATIVDFIIPTEKDDITADSERKKWLEDLSKVRRVSQ